MSPTNLPLLDTWSVEDVCQRLVSCAWASPHFRHKCRLHRINGVALQELTKEDLRDDFQVQELGVVKEILRNIRKLRDGEIPEVNGWPETPAVPEEQSRPHAATPEPPATEAPPAQQPRPSSSLDHHRRHLPPLRQEIVRRTHTALSSETPVPFPKAADRSRPPPAQRPSLHKEPPLAPSPGWSKAEGQERPASQEQAVAVVPAADEATKVAPQTDSPPLPPVPAPTCRVDLRRPSSGKARRLSVFRPGILEQERRYTEAKTLFHLWDMSSNSAEDGSGYIEMEELRDVLAPYYGWSDAEKDACAKGMLQKIDTSEDMRVDVQEFQQFINQQTGNKKAKEFDKFLSHLRERVSKETQNKEKERRVRSLRRLFRRWDADLSGFIDATEFRDVITRYNDYSIAQGKAHAQVILTDKDRDRDGKLDQEEFLEHLLGHCNRLPPEDFDFLSYRISRSVEDLQAEGSRGLTVEFRPVTVEDLESPLELSSPACPILLHGRGVDPSKQVEVLAERKGRRLRATLIRHEKSERCALDDLIRWGFGRGHWIYITLEYDLAEAERFLRRVGVLVQQQALHTLHRKFRLWVMVPTNRYIMLPLILRQHAIEVDLETVRAVHEAAFREKQRELAAAMKRNSGSTVTGEGSTVTGEGSAVTGEQGSTVQRNSENR
eukprot:Hpha_TRINITY_DN19241_c0_g1::TRINITY_DN19241_c0_g1_i1::g.194231::m.194231